MRNCFSEIWQYFTKNLEENSVRCNLCSHIYANTGASPSSGRFWQHLIRMHPHTYAITERANTRDAHDSVSMVVAASHAGEEAEESNGGEEVRILEATSIS